MTKRGLVGAWCPSLGATGLRLRDRSGRNNHGTLTNMLSTAWTTSGGKGALSFVGTNGAASRINFGRFLALENASALTISFWAKWIGNETAQAGFFSYAQPNGFADDIFMLYSGGQYMIQINNGADGGRTLSGSASGNWDCFSVAFSNGSLQFFLNGNQQTLAGSFSYPATTSAGSANHQLWLGGYVASNTHWFLRGELDDFRIYNRALTAPEIRQLYTGGRGFGLLPERPRHLSKAAAAAGFKAYWARRQSQLIGGGF